MASCGPACKTVCCIFLVFVNVISIIFGVLFAIIGILLLWGSALIQTLSASFATGPVGANQTAQTGIFGSQGSVENYYSSLAALSGSAAGLLIAFGVVVVVVGCIGCFGACIGIPACLVIYMVCVCLLFVGQVVVIIIWFANSNVFKHSIRGTLEQQVKRFRGDYSQNIESATLSVTQVMFGCCGVDNGTDFRLAPDWNRTHTMQDKDNKTFTFTLTHPVSCCKYNLANYKLIDPYCPYNGSLNAAVSNFGVGCYEKVWLVIDTYWQLNRFFYALCGCLGIEILLLIGAIVIYRVRRQQQRDMVTGHEAVEYKMVTQKA